MARSDLLADWQLEALRAHPQRLAAVRRAELLDSPSEESFDSLTRLARTALGAAASFLSVVDVGRDFYKSHAGFTGELAAARQLTGRTFCHYTLDSSAPLVISDVEADPIWSRVPTVHSLGVKAYVGVPLEVDGQIIGSLCAIDLKPRQWSASELEIITQLAASAARELRLRAALRVARNEVVYSQQLVRERERMLAMVAHDLRTPLQTIALGAQVLRETESAQTRVTEKLLKAVSVMQRTVEELMADHARSRDTEPRPQSLRAKQLLSDAFDALKSIAEHSSIQLRLGEQAEARVQVDYAQLMRVLTNLISNSIKYCPVHSWVELSSRLRDGGVEIEVQDNGPGIAAEDQAAAFSAGFRGRTASASAPDGAGLGLAIVRELVEKNAGRVTLSSRPGAGTTVHVWLPLAAQDDAAEHACEPVSR